MIKIIPLAIPFFFLLIGVELVVARLQGRSDYLRFNDAITALSCGIGSQVLKVFTAAAGLAVYWGCYELARPLWSAWVADPMAWWWWVAAMFLVDHQYYWWHRHSHRVNALWAAHVVHHQSQEYNLAVALRQALFTNITSVPYYLPLAVVGIHPLVFGLSGAINTLYQFWIHTRTIGRLGPLEWVLNTPSHHRVHHGINPQYIDKNHAGILIVWDRMYGTFVNEDEEPVYGTVAVLDSYDPLWANLEVWARLIEVAWNTPRWQDKLYVWVAPPEWTPQGNKPIPEVHAETFTKWDVPLARGVAPYVVLQLLLMTAGLVWLLWQDRAAPLPWLALLGASVLWATWSWGQVFHRRRLGVLSEVARHLAVLPTLFILLWGSTWLVPALAVGAAVAVPSLVVLGVLGRSWSTRPEPAGPGASAAMAVVGSA